ncbi:MAG: hypothetical protein HZC28_03540 [Spirochaetes bacterium]|nr:hypothetical protein [Spirochaetota bacterium]
MFGLINDLIDTFKYHIMNVRDKELEERIRYKEVRERLRKSGQGFVDFKDNTISDKFAMYIFQLYRIIDQLMKALRSDFIEKGGDNYARHLIESSFSDQQQKLLASFSHDAIMNEIIRTSNVNATFEGVKERFKQFQQHMTGANEQVNGAYNQLKVLAEMSKFDFYIFLKTFDTTLPEGAYDYKPVFTSKDNRYLVDDLMKLDSAVNSIAVTKELSQHIKDFELFRGITPLGDKSLKVFLNTVAYLKESRILTDMITLLLHDLNYAPAVTGSNDNVVTGYVNNLAKEIKATVDKIVVSLKSDRIKKVRAKAFQGIELARLANYNDERNSMLTSYQCLTFRNVEPLTYLKTFVLERYEQYMKDIFNQILLEAEFVRKDRQSLLSDAFYALNGTREAILSIDNMLSENGEEGKRLKMLMLGMKKSRSNQEMINTLVNKVDAQVLDVIKKAIKNILTMNDIAGAVVRDVRGNTKKEIYNPSKIAGGTSASKLIDKIERSLNDIALFLALMNNFVK